jgi:hypothetical protein
MRKNPKTPPKPYEIGYRRPPKKFWFKKGRSGNPSGKRKPPSGVDLKAELESELAKRITVRSGKRIKVLTKGAAGIEQLVDQFAKGGRNACRDLFRLCDQLGVAVTNRDALEKAIEDALSAEDEALLADFVERHGGQYPARTGSPWTETESLPTEDAKLPPGEPRKLLTAPPGNK